MNKIVIGVVVAIIVVVGAVMLLGNKSQPSTTSTTAVATPTPTSASPTASPSGTMEKKVTMVTLTANGFEPSTVTIHVGDTVTWTNKSGTNATVNSDPHPTHTAYPPLNLGMMADGATVSLTFNKVGTYGYHNHLNPSEKGTVIVK